MSHGPLIFVPEIVSLTAPLESSTRRQPRFAVEAMPFFVGRLPTITNPFFRTVSAVVRPTPPGHGPGSPDARMCANILRCPPGEISTIVLPVPCRLALSLKLRTRTSPDTSDPLLTGTRATP